MRKLREKQDGLMDKYYTYMEKYGCETCTKYYCGCINKYAERFCNCADCCFFHDVSSLCYAIDDVCGRIDKLIEGEYAKCVFEYGSIKKKVLINSENGEECAWEEVFGKKFDDVSCSLRRALVGLVEGYGRFRIK